MCNNLDVYSHKIQMRGRIVTKTVNALPLTSGMPFIRSRVDRKLDSSSFLCCQCEENTSLAECPRYLKLPFSKANLPSNNQTLKGAKESFWITSFLCSTKLTQNGKHFSLGGSGWGGATDLLAVTLVCSRQFHGNYVNVWGKKNVNMQGGAVRSGPLFTLLTNEQINLSFQSGNCLFSVEGASRR